MPITWNLNLRFCCGWVNFMEPNIKLNWEECVEQTDSKTIAVCMQTFYTTYATQITKKHELLTKKRKEKHYLEYYFTSNIYYTLSLNYVLPLNNTKCETINKIGSYCRVQIHYTHITYHQQWLNLIGCSNGNILHFTFYIFTINIVCIKITQL